jgi:uncharacterized protein (TIGR02001 family)
MAKLRLLLAVISSLTTATVLADFGGNIAVMTDYVWRGVSQTLGDPALQAELNYEHDSGLYAGVWGSNVDFFDGSDPEADPEEDDEADVEIDIWAGFAGETAGGLGWDVGAIAYLFPGANRDVLDNNEEFYAGLSYGLFSATVYQDFDNDTTYVDLAAEFELPGEFGLGVHGGSFNFDDATDYVDWSVALSKELAGFGFELSYTDTDFSGVECEEFSGKRRLCDKTLIFTVSWEF